MNRAAEGEVMRKGVWETPLSPSSLGCYLKQLGGGGRCGVA